MECIVFEVENAKFKLSQLWDEIGLSEEEKEDKLRKLTFTLLKELRKFQDNETFDKQQRVKNVEEIGLKLYHLTKDLKVPHIAEPDGQMNLIELEKYLKCQLLVYEEEKNKRIERLKTLRSSERELCSKLKEQPMELPDDNIPTLESLDLLQKVVNSLSKELKTRKKQFYSYRASVQANMEELHLKPRSSFEREIFSGVEDFFLLSVENIHKMKMLSKDLQMKIYQQKDEEEELKNKIKVLWDRLGIDEEKKQRFLEQLIDSTFENIKKLEDQLRELEELKQQNLGCYINKLRRELEDLWELCYVSEDEKENFSPYFSEEYTDNVLEEHEKEVYRLREFYFQNEDVFNKIKKWKELWSKLTELDEKVNDPARLWKNRGCALLQEEKERKKVNNELPRLEKDIEHKINKWESENSRPFLVCGQSFKNFIQYTWQVYNEKKNKEKLQRQESRNKQLQQEALLGTTMKRTPSKRNLLRSDTLHASKYMRSNESQRCPSGVSSQGSSTSSGSKNQTLKSRNLKPSRLTRQNSRRNVNSSALASLNSSEMSSYDKFTEGIHLLSERENIRSSVVPKSMKSPLRNNKLSIIKTPTTNAAVNRSRFTPTSGPKRVPFSPNVNTLSFAQRFPSTLPRRRSARLNPSMSNMSSLKKSFNTHGFRSPQSPYPGCKLSTPLRNRLNILM